MIRFRLVSFGCKVNQYETELLREVLLRVVPDSVELKRSASSQNSADSKNTTDSKKSSDPDWIFVNTCTVTAESDAKCRKAIHRLAAKYPHANLVVWGCYASRSPETFQSSRFPEIHTVLVTQDDLERLVTRLAVPTIAAASTGQLKTAESTDKTLGLPLISQAVEGAFQGGIAQFPRLHRAMLKVQDGCTQHCSYCIVPEARPGLTSRPMARVLTEAMRLITAGHHEIVLTGTHLGLYGLNRPYQKDVLDILDSRNRIIGGNSEYAEFIEDAAAPQNGESLTLLVRRLTELETDRPYRIRLSSLEAPELTPELLELAATRRERFCPHFHLPMQHAADSVLRRMRRRCSSEQFIHICQNVRQTLPDAELTTDVMVGFPGETPDDFQRLCDVIRMIEFSQVHIFRYSARPSTDAARFANPIPPEIKQQRAEQLAQLATQLKFQRMRRRIGQVSRVIIEGISRWDPCRAIGTDEYHYLCELPPGTAGQEGIYTVRIHHVACETPRLQADSFDLPCR